ncbi:MULTISPECIES: DUF2812 domain-containing protein [Clostridium]|uniref:DUF2812 domain-containing protein n=1 Tax=Clostridium TaxID=1485 RepID=UPI0008256D98|nr:MULTISPECIES: DUF2812 domain-containing protein [Clostridium]PJI06944.1 DUF2812 domain-containing protein [Clostridium sp. CT7]
MKNKYFAIGGFAFSEESDMEKLKNYAKEGWILEGISGEFFYKLKRGKPQNIEYTLDYQDEPTEEYFDLFSEAGWTRVVSSGNIMHIFSAPEGTKPIYTERESEIDKYTRMKKLTCKGSIYSLIAVIAFAALSCISFVFIRPVFIAAFILFILSICTFIFSFMPYLAYKGRINKLNGNKSILGFNTKLSIFYAFISVSFIFMGIRELVKKKYCISLMFILIAVFDIILIVSNFREDKILCSGKKK